MTGEPGAATAPQAAAADAATIAAPRQLSSSSRSRSTPTPTPTSFINHLPNELLTAIFSHLDASSSLERRFRDDASTLLDEYYAARGRRPSRKHPLKSSSLVCRRWRGTVLPFLFRHVLWTIQQRLEEPPAEVYHAAAGDLRKVADGFAVLAHLRRHGLAACVDSVTLHVPCPEHLIDDPTELVGRYGLVPNSSTLPSTSGHHGGGGGVGDESYDEDNESVIMSESGSLVVAEVNGHATWANTWFWDMLFAVVDPLRVSFLAAPVVLATMFSRKVFTRCQPLMMTRYHLISVSRQDRTSLPQQPPPSPLSDNNEDEDCGGWVDHDMDDNDDDDDDDGATPDSAFPPAPPCDNLPCELFAHRRWTSLLANEGSSVSIYKTDDYGQTPPSPLFSLLSSKDPATRRFFRRTLCRLAYIAIMPMATHIQRSFAAPRFVPARLEELFIQVMPRDIDLDHDISFQGLEMEDLLMERDSVYGLLFGRIFIPGPQREWEPLRVFETGDSADEVAWAEAVETVQASTSRWDVESQGRFVRNLVRETGRGRRRRSTDESLMQALYENVN